MRVSIKTLSWILAAQLCLAGYFWYSSQKSSNQDTFSGKPLLQFGFNQLKEIHIKGENEKSTLLVKQGEHWLIDNYYHVPASTAKVDSFIHNIQQLKSSWPVATTKDTANRFKVAPEQFVRKIIFVDEQGNGESLFLGTAPTYKKVHARAINENNIYAIPFNLHEASDKPVDWIQADLLHFNKETVSAIHLPDYSLQKEAQADSFTVSGLNATESIIPYEVDALVNQITKLNFSDILQDNAQEFALTAKPEIEYSVKLESGESVRFSFSKVDTGNEENDDAPYHLTTTTSPYVFKVEKQFVDAFMHKRRETLVKAIVDDAPVNAEENRLAEEDPPIS